MDIIVILFDIIFVIVIIVLKSYLLLWLATRKNWESNLHKSFLTNIFWLLIMVGISITFIITLPLLFSELMINFQQDFFWFTFINLVFLALDFIIGYLLVSYFFNGSPIDSFVISLILLITEKTFLKVIEATMILIIGINFGIYDGIFFPISIV
ncbi:hypothetical protein LCGC14_1160060 [marine sediment metagenome]|uniref:Uncharacterized protein n=1 Tax=marine sediment metagenome TaxID=412755 RepID=A0A0F9PYI5_9ZZZZ